MFQAPFKAPCTLLLLVMMAFVLPIPSAGFALSLRGSSTWNQRLGTSNSLWSTSTRRQSLPRSFSLSSSSVSMSDEPLFEKDCVEFIMPSPLKDKYDKPKMLGAIVDENELLVQPLCVREVGSNEFYSDSREEPIILEADQIVRIMDTYPSQRPIPSLGGGIGYGAEAVDVWELQEEVGEDCVVPFEDTGMGFHQKGWV